MTLDSTVNNILFVDLTPLTLGNVFCKYADDTYLVIPASNVDSRTCEIENIRSWLCANNLNLNLKKVIRNCFCGQHAAAPNSVT